MRLWLSNGGFIERVVAEPRSERANSMESKTLKTRTKVNTVRDRPAVRELCERSICERTIMSERSIESDAISNQLCRE